VLLVTSAGVRARVQTHAASHTSRPRSLICATFDYDTSDVPALAFVLTRACSLLRATDSTTGTER
jgi:hypothetical protein